jgi:hypothetical protein
MAEAKRWKWIPWFMQPLAVWQSSWISTSKTRDGSANVGEMNTS